MVPRFVLLERHVEFVIGGPTGGASDKAAAGIFNRKATEAAVQAMKPDPSVLEPPEVSRLTMMEQMSGLPTGGGFVSSTDKALVVLYAGHYRPGCYQSPSSGCYLVYDASTNSLSTAPQIPRSPSFRSLGRGAAILSRGGGTYVLAEIGTGPDDEGMLYLWHSTSLDRGQSPQWDLKSVRLPPQVADDPTNFFIDMTFSYADSSSVCWVDLLKGVLVCDLLKATEEPEVTFVPLPHGYSIDDDTKPRPRPQQFRTMGCVNGVIKFVALVGFYENNYASDNIMLKIWTLLPDLKEWKLACSVAVKDLWASTSFHMRNLPKLPPVFPILSCNEDEVLYLSLKEIERKNAFDEFGQFEGVHVVTKAHHVLRVDVIQNKVLHCTKITQGRLITSHWPTMLATDFTSYLHAWKDHEGGRKASMAKTNRGKATMAGTSGKYVNH